MRGLTFTSGGTTYRQITKKTAKKLYLQGFPVVLCPCNLRPFTPWHVEHVLKKSDRAQFVAANDFDNVVNSSIYYRMGTHYAQDVLDTFGDAETEV